jgi:hypothetical protein
MTNSPETTARPAERASVAFAVLWRSLSEQQRRFLLAAYDIDRRLPHSEGLSRVMPMIVPRTIGPMIGAKDEELDDLVRTLADLKLILLLNNERGEFGLISGIEIGELIEARRRRRINWITLGICVVVFIAETLRLAHRR